MCFEKHFVTLPYQITNKSFPGKRHKITDMKQTTKRSASIEVANNIEMILGNSVKWNYNDFTPEELPCSEIEHIEELIKGGSSCGELCYYDSDTDEEKYGWWEIVNWRDIACGLRNTLIEIMDKCNNQSDDIIEKYNKALQLFDENWG